MNYFWWLHHKNRKLRREQRDKAKRQHHFEAGYDWAAGILLRSGGQCDPTKNIHGDFSDFDKGVVQAHVDFNNLTTTVISMRDINTQNVISPL